MADAFSSHFRRDQAAANANGKGHRDNAAPEESPPGTGDPAVEEAVTALDAILAQAKVDKEAAIKAALEPKNFAAMVRLRGVGLSDLDRLFLGLRGAGVKAKDVSELRQAVNRAYRLRQQERKQQERERKKSEEEEARANELEERGKWERKSANAGTSEEAALPRIIITVDERAVNDEAIAALRTELALFQRSNLLVRVLRDDAKSCHVLRPPGAPRIALLPNALLREMLAARARWFAIKLKNHQSTLVPAHPPDWSVAEIAARGSWTGIRHLESVIESPTLRLDGTVLDKPGWDEATGLLYEPRISFPPIPNRPTIADAQRAVDLLVDLIAQFPLASSDHYAAWLAALLTPLARFAFPGPAPLFLFTANAPGSGKTLLASIIAMITVGRDFARTSYPANDVEMAKTITAIALAGDQMILLDNIDSAIPLGCASLDAALTGTTWKQRLLGVSAMTSELPLFTVWFATGNNVSFRGDTHRRVIRCRVESSDEHPEQRTGFKYPDLLGYVLANRAVLVPHLSSRLA